MSDDLFVPLFFLVAAGIVTMLWWMFSTSADEAYVREHPEVLFRETGASTPSIGRWLAVTVTRDAIELGIPFPAMDGLLGVRHRITREDIVSASETTNLFRRAVVIVYHDTPHLNADMILILRDPDEFLRVVRENFLS